MYIHNYNPTGVTAGRILDANTTAVAVDDILVSQREHHHITPGESCQHFVSHLPAG